ncbi:MAG: redoxin domain-containing protein [Bacteroidales bacterium]|nr:redoxin domain-containing protein [Bacteroidales bacterium]
MNTLKENQKAPHFTGTSQTGKTVALDNFKGKKLILYFYSKDNTSGCTTEACNLAENYKILRENGNIKHIIEKVKTKDHTNQILNN